MADDHENYKLIDECYNKFIEGFDIVCPSRFIKGGKMEGNTFLKEILTRLASFFFRILLLYQLKIQLMPLDFFQELFLKK